MRYLKVLFIGGWFGVVVFLLGCSSPSLVNYPQAPYEFVPKAIELVKVERYVSNDSENNLIVLDLGGAISRALKHSPLLRRNEAVVGEQLATVQQRAGSYLPTVEGLISTNRIGKEVTYPGEAFAGYALQARSMNTSLSLTWVLYDSGLRGAQLDAAMSLLEAARWDKDDVTRSVISDTIAAFYKAEFSILATQSFVVLERVAKDNADAARERVDAGAGSVADKLLTATSYAQTRLRTLETQAEETRALADLAAIVGVPRSESLTVSLRDTERIDLQAFNSNTHALLQAAVAQHPRVKSALNQLAAARHHVRAAQAEGMPALSMVGSMYQSRTPLQESTVEQRVQGWSVGLQLKVPLFDGFSRQNGIALAKARQIAKETELRESVMDVESLIWNALHDLHTATQRTRLAQELRSVSLEALEVAQGRYQAGVGPISELLQAQGDAAEGTRQYVQAAADWYSAKMRLANSVGRLEVME